MAGFRYQALDSNGKSLEGVIEADNARLARTNLREQGLWVSELQELAGSSGDQSGKAEPPRRRVDRRAGLDHPPVLYACWKPA